MSSIRWRKKHRVSTSCAIKKYPDNLRMTIQTTEDEAAADVMLVAIGHAMRTAKDGDVWATTAAILCRAVELATSSLSPVNRAAIFNPLEE